MQTLLQILEFGASADLIPRLMWCIHKFTRRPSRTFLVPGECGWSGPEIDKMLKQNRIRNWDHMVLHRHYVFTVYKRDYRRAMWLLRQNGIEAR